MRVRLMRCEGLGRPGLGMAARLGSRGLAVLLLKLPAAWHLLPTVVGAEPVHKDLAPHSQGC